MKESVTFQHSLNKAEIETDGKTVWVNVPVCIGRFCKLSGEIQNPESLPICQTKPIWRDWKFAMKAAYGLDVPDKYQPEWSK